MAISPKDTYPPDQIDTTDIINYPEGKGKNISAPGNTDGTPWERGVINDIFGLQQFLLATAGLSPNGTPDTAVSSQYFQAMRQLLSPTVYSFEVGGANTWSLADWVDGDRMIEFHIVGGGGGGSSGWKYVPGMSGYSGAGGGGGAGYYMIQRCRAAAFRAMVPGNIVNVLVGAGGAGGAAPVGDQGANNGIAGANGELTQIYSGDFALSAGGGRGALDVGRGGNGRNGGGGGSYHFSSTGGSSAKRMQGGTFPVGAIFAGGMTENAYGDQDLVPGENISGGNRVNMQTNVEISNGVPNELFTGASNVDSGWGFGSTPGNGSQLGSTILGVGGGVGAHGLGLFMSTGEPPQAGGGGVGGSYDGDGGIGFGAGGGGGGFEVSLANFGNGGGDGAPGAAWIVVY